MYKNVMFGLMIGIGAACLPLATIAFNNTNNIVPGPNPHSVLIKGTACVINDLPEVTDDMMRQAAEHCIDNR